MDGDSVGPPEKRRGKLRGCVLASLVVIGLVIGAFVLWRFHWRGRVRAELQAIRDAGYPVTPEELDASYAWPVGDNAADVYLEAFAAYAEPSDEDDELLPIVGTAELPARGQPLPEGMKEAIKRHVSANNEALDLLHEAAEIEGSRYPIDLTRGLNTLLRHRGGGVRRCARLLALDALMHAEEGNAEMATRSVQSSLALARSFSQEPLWISQLFRIACEWISVESLERVLNRTELTEDQTAALGRAMREAEDPEALRRVFAGERCVGSSVFQLPATAKSAFLAAPTVLWVLYRVTGLEDVDHAIYLRHVGELVAASEKPLPERLAALKGMDGEIEDIPPVRRITRILLSAIGRMAESDAREAAMLRCARTALAVDRYRQERGKLPETLQDLVPEHMESILEDPFDGKPLRYRKLPKGYVVYSVGPDLSDEGGKEREEREEEGYDVTFTVER